MPTQRPVPDDVGDLRVLVDPSVGDGHQREKAGERLVTDIIWGGSGSYLLSVVP